MTRLAEAIISAFEPPDEALFEPGVGREKFVGDHDAAGPYGALVAECGEAPGAVGAADPGGVHAAEGDVAVGELDQAVIDTDAAGGGYGDDSVGHGGAAGPHVEGQRFGEGVDALQYGV